MGIVVTLVSEREMKRSAANGKHVQRVILERVEKTKWRLIVILKGHTDGMTLGRYRGGTRHWAKLENALTFIERVMPAFPEEEIDVFLSQRSDSSAA